MHLPPCRLATLATLLLALGLPAIAGAAQIVDRGVASPALQVNNHGVALVTYEVHGAQRHVLYRGAVDWTATFKRDYSGGSEHKVANYKSFANSCKPYTGSQVALMVAACDAPDGSHWALQQWSRLWADYGGDKAPAELYISHWRGDVGALQIQTDYSYHGKNQHLWGGFTFHGRGQECRPVGLASAGSGSGAGAPDLYKPDEPDQPANS